MSPTQSKKRSDCSATLTLAVAAAFPYFSFICCSVRAVDAMKSVVPRSHGKGLLQAPSGACGRMKEEDPPLSTLPKRVSVVDFARPPFPTQRRKVRKCASAQASLVSRHPHCTALHHQLCVCVMMCVCVLFVLGFARGSLLHPNQAKRCLSGERTIERSVRRSLARSWPYGVVS